MTRSKKGSHFFQEKCWLDTLLEAGVLSCEAADMPMDQNLKLFPDQGLLEDQECLGYLLGT